MRSSLCSAFQGQEETSLVIENGGSEDLAIAALLHDALEDHPEQITVDDLRDRFGTVVADVVVACSDVVQREPDFEHYIPPRPEARTVAKAG